MTSDLRERLQQVDPAPVTAEPPSGAMQASAVLLEIERRMGMDTRDTTTEAPAASPAGDTAAPARSPEPLKKAAPGEPASRWSRARVAVAALGVVALVAAAYAVINAGDDPSIDAARAQEIAEQYVAVFNEGEDSASVIALFTDDSVHSFNFGNSSDIQQTRAESDMRIVWNMAQGTRLEGAVCAVIDGVEGGTFTVECAYATVDAPARAAGIAGVPTTTTLTITSEGISSLHEAYGFPDFNEAFFPFSAWVGANYSADIEDAVGCCGGETVAESIARGQARAEYAQLWNDYLTENGCAYNQSRQSCLGPDG